MPRVSSSMKDILTKTTYRQPDSGYSWVVLGSAFLIIWLSGGMGFSFGVVMPNFVKDFNENRQNGALVGSIMIAVSLGESVVASQLCQRYSCRLLCAIGHVLCATGYILSSVTQSIAPLFFTYSLLIGCGFGLIFNSVFLATQQYFRKRRSFAIGLLSAGVGAGVISWGPLSQILINQLGWRGFFRVIAGLYCALAFLSFPFDPKVGTRPTRDLNQAVVIKPPSFFRTMTDFSVWKYRPYSIAVASVCIASLGHYAVIIHLIKYAEELGISATKASTLYIANGIATVTARIIAGRLCDLAFIRPIYVNLLAELVSGIVTICCPLARSFTHLLVIIAIYGFADGLFRSTINILFMQTADPNPVKVASAFGNAMMATALPTAIGPALAGFLADQFGSYRIAFFVSGAITLSSALIYLPEIYLHVKETRDKKQQQQHPQLDSVYNNPTVTDMEIEDTRL